jgi:hypothetical protein
MIRHGPTCLDGPLTKDRGWWAAGENREAVLTAGDARETEFRPDLVRRVRAEIAAGTYDTPEKWDLALDRLLDRLSHE